MLAAKVTPATALAGPDGAKYAPAAALLKSPSSASVGSALSVGAEHDASVGGTLCEQAGCDGAASTHSHEIALIDLAPAELDIARELGGRAPETIECLRINRCRMDGHAFASLVDDLCIYDLPNLHTVDVSQNHIGGARAGAALGKLLAHARAVRTLSLGWNQLALSDLGAMAASGTEAYGVRHLDLRANPLAAPSLMHSRRRAARLDCEDDAGCDVQMDRLVDAMPQLTHLFMAQATISDNALVALLHALTSRGAQLEYIGLEWLGLGSRLATVRSIMSRLAPADLVAGRPLPLPLHLNLASNNLGDSGVKIIAESGAVLSSLTLACNFITERGTGILAEWLPRSGLTALELSDNHFGDQGISSLLATDGRRISAGSPYTSITSLGLNSCCLSDASLRMLTDALDCSWAQLTSLRILRNSRISRGARIHL